MTAKTTMPDLKINTNIQDFLEGMRDEEIEILEKSIVSQGVRDAIVVWDKDKTIVDGHNRWKICLKHNIVPPVKELSFDDEEAIKDWILENQLGRRNLTPNIFLVFLGTLYNRQNKGEKSEGEVVEKLAKTAGVSPKTVRRSGEFAEGVEVLERVMGKIEKNAALTGKSALTKEDIREISKAKTPAAVKRTVEIVKEKAAAKKKSKAKVKSTAKSKIKYEVVLTEPDFYKRPLADLKTARPATQENACLFVMVEDENLTQGLELMKAWGFGYEASYILIEEGRQDRSNWSVLKHKQLLIGSKGIIGGPTSGNEPPSIMRSANILDSVFNTVGQFPLVKDAKDKLVINAGDRTGWTTA